MNKANDNLIHIDGSILEGGGQILRISAALSAILQKPIRVFNIRKRRSEPGLKAQHLNGLDFVRNLCGGELVGDEFGSPEITFRPGKLEGGNFTVDTYTAGSITLILQIAFPCILFSSFETKLVVKGGTNVDFSPSIDYFVEVFQPLATRFGAVGECRLVKRGFYPVGGGEVIFQASPLEQLNAVDLVEPLKITSITGTSMVSGTVQLRLSTEAADKAEKYLKRHVNLPIDIKRAREPSENQGANSVTIWLFGLAEGTDCKLAGSCVAKRGQRAEDAGECAAKQLFDNISRPICVDNYAQDQLIIYMALAEGRSRIRTGPLTLHTRTAMHITTLMTGVEFKVTDLKTTPESFIIECEGLGVRNTSIY